MLPPHAVPVRTRLTVLEDGANESCRIVFCEGELRSVPVSRCEACRFAGPKSTGSTFEDVIDCGLSILPIDRKSSAPSFPPAVAGALPVALALVGPVLCLEDDLPWAGARRALISPARSSGVPVVDHIGALVGILPAMATARAEREGPGDGRARVADFAVSAASVYETESLSDAFTAMIARRAREITVVSDGMWVVGVLRDVDALRFVAHVARTGSRPAPEQAA